MGVEGQDGEGSHALQPLRELIMMVVLVIPFFQYAIVSVGTGEYLSCSKCVRGVIGSQKGLGGRHDSSISGHYNCTSRPFSVHVPPVSFPFLRFMTSLLGFLLEHDR